MPRNKLALISAIMVVLALVITGITIIPSSSNVYADGSATSVHHFTCWNAGGGTVWVIHAYGNAQTKTRYENGNLVASAHYVGGYIYPISIVPSGAILGFSASGKYYTKSGTPVTISGYTLTPSWCSPDKSCVSFQSFQKKTFTPSMLPITGYQSWSISLRYPYIYLPDMSGIRDVRTPNSGTYSIK